MILFYKTKLILKQDRSCQTEAKISGQSPLPRSTRFSTVMHDHPSMSTDHTIQKLFSFATLLLDTCQNLVSTGLVVGYLEKDMQYILELFTFRRYEENTCSSAVNLESAIEVHNPKFWSGGRCWNLIPAPFCHEIHH